MDKKTFVKSDGSKVYVRPDDLDNFKLNFPDAEERDTSWFEGEEGLIPDEIQGWFSKTFGGATGKIDNTPFYEPIQTTTEEAETPSNNVEETNEQVEENVQEDSKEETSPSQENQKIKEEEQRKELEKKFFEIYQGDPSPDISIEDLKFKVEHPYGRKGPGGEIITPSAEGPIVTKDGKVIKKEDYSQELTNELAASASPGIGGATAYLSPTDVVIKRPETNIENQATNEDGERLYEYDGMKKTYDELFEMFEGENATEKLPEGTNFDDFIKYQVLPVESGDNRTDDQIYLDELKDKRDKGTATKEELERLKYWQEEYDKENRLNVPLLDQNFIDNPHEMPKLEGAETVKEKLLQGTGNFLLNVLDIAVGQEKEFSLMFNEKYEYHGFSAKEAKIGKNAIVLTGPEHVNGNIPTSEKINLNSDDALEQINNFIKKYSLNPEDKKFSQLNISKEITKTSRESSEEAEITSLKKKDEVFNKLHILSTGQDDPNAGTNVEYMSLLDQLGKDGDIWKLSDFNELNDILNSNAYQKFKKESGYVPPKIEKKGGDFAATSAASEMEQFLKNLQDDNISFPEKEKYKKHFERLQQEERNKAIELANKKNELNSNVSAPFVEANLDEYSEEVANVNNNPINRALTNSIFQSEYNSLQTTKIDELMDNAPSNTREYINYVSTQEINNLTKEQENVIKRINYNNKNFKPILDNQKAIRNDLDQNKKSTTDLFEEYSGENGIFKKVYNEDTKETTYEQIVDEDFLQNNANNIYKKNGVILTQEDYNKFGDKIVEDNPIVINGETIKPGQEGFDEGAQKIIEKYKFPSNEETKLVFDDIQKQVNSGQITLAQGNKKWKEYTNNLTSQQNDLKNELNSYESEYKKQAEKVNKLLLDFQKDQENKKLKADKEIESSSKNVLNQLKEFKSKYNPLKQDYDLLIDQYKTNSNSLETFFKLDESYKNKIEELGLNKTTAGILAAEGMRQLDSGFTFINLAVESNKAFVRTLDFGKMVWDTYEKIGDKRKAFFENNFGAAGEYANNFLDKAKSLVLAPSIGLLYDEDNPILKALGKESTDKYGHAQSFWEEVGDRQEIAWHDIERQTRKAPTFEEAWNGSLEDKWDHFSQTLVEFAPLVGMMTLGGGFTYGSYGIMATNAAGGKYKQYEDELDLYQRTYGNYGHDHSFGDMVLSANIVGAVEAGSEMVDAFIMRGVGRYLMKSSPIPNPLKVGVKNYLSRLLNPARLGKAVMLYEANSFANGASEWLAEFGENVVDKYMMGKTETHLLDNTNQAFWTGAALGKFMQSPKIFADVISPFMPDQNKQSISSISNEMMAISEKIAKEKTSQNPNLESIEKLEEQYAQLVSKSGELMQEDLKRIDLMHPTEKKILVEIDKRNAIDRKTIKEIEADSNLTLEQRTDRITDLASNIESRNKRKNSIIGKYPSNVVNENYNAQVETLKQTAKLAEEMGGPSVKIKELSQEDFAKHVRKYESDQQNMSSQQVEEVARHFGDMKTGLNEVINDKDASVEEIEAAKELVNDASNQVNLANNILNNSDYGVMQPRYDNQGRIRAVDILINKDSSVKDGMFNTDAHEFIHAAFSNTLKSDPAMRQILGGQLQEIFENDTNVEFTPGKRAEFNNRVNNYHPDLRGEEALAIASEMMADGSIKFKDGPIKNLGGIFRRFGQFYLGHDIKFDNKNDIKNFLKDYHKSLKTHKPNPAIARMMAKGANGKIFRDARTPAERKLQSMHSKAVQQNIRSNPNLKPSFDNLVKYEDGSPRYNSHQDFKTSPEFYEGYNKIVDSNLLDGLIKQGMTDRGLPPDAMRDFTRKVKEELGLRYLNNFSLDKNDSLFGWLTGVSGGAGMSIIYRAKGDVMKQYVKEGRAQDVSIDKQIGEAGTIADILEGDINQETRDTFETEEIILTKQSDTQIAGILVKDALNFSNQSIKTIENIAKDVDYSDKSLNYKSVKDNLLKKNNPLFGILDAVSNEIGIDANRIIKNQDLNSKQRTAAQKYILKNSDVLIKLLPEGQDQSGQATGVANTKLGQFYTKGERAKMSKGATAAGLATQTKRKDITKDEFTKLFGINSDGSFQPGRNADGAIRALVTQAATSLANQELRITGNAGARLLDGKSDALFSKKQIDPIKKQQVVDAMRNYGKTSYDVVVEGMDPQLLNFVEQLALENYLESPGGYNEVMNNFESAPIEIKNLFKQTKGKRVKYIGPKLYNTIDGKSNKGTYTDVIKDLAKSTETIIKNSHPDISTKFLLSALGFKDSGTYKINGKEVVINNKTARSTRTATFKDFDFLQDIKRKDSVIKAEEKFMIDNGIDPKVIKNFQPMEYKGEIKKILDNIWGQDVDVNTKKQLLEEAKSKIKDINDGNQAVMKYVAAKLKQAYNNNQISPLSLYIAGKYQTNIVEGTRAASTLDYVYLTDGVQIGLPKPSKTAKDYDTKYKKHIDSWKEIKDWDTAYNTAKKRFPNLKGNELLDKTVSLLTPKNEHLKPSADTHARRNDYIFGGNTALDNISNNHKTFYGPVFVADVLDAKIEIDGKLVDNKVSLEGEFRLVKFAKGYQSNIFNINGKDVAKHIAEQEGIIDKFNEMSKDNIEINNEKTLQNLKLDSSNSLSSKKAPKVKGISVFDFDDTLGITKSGVRAKIPNIDGRPKPNRKVIFLAGGAGSGKSNVVNKLNLEKQGFKIVNSDISLEWLKKNSGLPADMRDLTKEQRSTLGKLGAESRKIARRKMMKYQGNANGVVVDGTGGSIKSMTNLVNEFKDKGYDVSMLYVETSLNTALERNRARKERSLLDTIVKRNHEAVQNNKSKFKEMFSDNFMEVKTDNLELGDPMPKKLVKKMDNFVSGYEKLRLDATEFAEQGDVLLKKGAEFDFSEFDKVVEGRPGPLLGKALERAKKYGTKDMFVLTARTQKSAQAIQEFLKSQGLNIPIENITGLANSTGNAKAQWMLEKFAEGYNDMYFADDALQNVDAVKKVLDQLDIKSDVVQAKLNQNNRLVDKSDSMKSKIIEPSFDNTINEEFNKILERKKGIAADKIVSEAEARRRGSQTNIARFFKSLYIPPSAEDFKGLMYYFVGKGKQGDADLKWFKEKLFDPFAKGIRSWNAYKQNMVNEYQALKKKFPKVSKSLNKLIPGTVFTNDTAIRTYLFDKAGHDIPGLSMQQKRDLIQHVKSNPDIMAFADALSTITRSKDGYPAPNANWAVSSIPGDMNALVNKVGRKQFLQEWINQKDNIFNKDNLNKIQAVYGNQFLESLNNILYRMENGGNRRVSPDSTVNGFVSWINGSVGAIMFFNMRSALLQTISTVNFINWSDNNIFKASAAFANQPQFWKDFAKLFNSDQLKQRRAGLQTDVSASELTKAFAERKMTPASVVSYLLSKGFTPTQLADSFAIAFGGASFYRNRFNKLKKEGMTDAQANEQAMLDFQEIAEETQQSSREDLVSQQQASVLGRMVLAFQNVTMQMGRLTKKAMSDLVNGRGDFKTNVSKIVYYAVVQNIVFAALQTGLAALMWGEDQEEIQDRTRRSFNQALDSFLRGTGLYGALVSTLKNTIIQWHLQKDKPFGKRDKWKIAQEMASLSPPIGAKMRKIMSAFDTEVFNEGVGEKLGFRVENPEIKKWASILEATTNLPLARILSKANNLEEAITGNHLLWQRAGLILGWKAWDVGIKDEELVKAKEEAKEERKEEKKEEKRKEKEEKKKQEEKEKKEKGIKKVRCSGIRSNGTRCKLTTETSAKSWKCVHHAPFKDGSDTDGDGKKEYRCIATKSNGQRCKNKTENTNKKCYAHQ